MKRQGAHWETNGSPKWVAGMQQQEFGGSISISAEGGPLRKCAKVEWLWELERERASPAQPSYNEGDLSLLGGRQNGDRSYNPFQPSSHRLKEDCEEVHPIRSRHELDMEVGYEDDCPTPIDNNLCEELKKLDKQQQDAEDAEHTRHLERMIEISKEYREKRTSVRAEERRKLIEKEKLIGGEQLQLQQHYQPRSSAAAAAGKETGSYHHRPPPSSTMHHGRDRWYPPPPVGTSRTEDTVLGGTTATPHPQVKEGRVPLPAGRVYNNNNINKPTPSR